MVDNEAARRLEQAIIDVAKDIREEFVNNDLSYMVFQVDVRGNVHGDLKITFELGQHVTTVEADTVRATVEEYFRRYGFDQQHNNLRITYSGETKKGV